jgi:hypothetical protein
MLIAILFMIAQRLETAQVVTKDEPITWGTLMQWEAEQQ